MGKKFNIIALAVVGFAFGFAPGSNAGSEIVRDYSAQAPIYDYRPAPPVYYAPPPVRVVVYTPPIRVFAFHRFYVRRPYCLPHWR